MMPCFHPMCGCKEDYCTTGARGVLCAHSCAAQIYYLCRFVRNNNRDLGCLSLTFPVSFFGHPTNHVGKDPASMQDCLQQDLPLYLYSHQRPLLPSFRFHMEFSFILVMVPRRFRGAFGQCMSLRDVWRNSIMVLMCLSGGCQEE